MNMEGSPEKRSTEERYDALMEQAEREITDMLLEREGEPNRAEAELTAEQILDDRCNDAGELYTHYADRVAEAPSPEVRQELLRGLLAEMEKVFAQGGYMRDITAKRVAAVMAQTLEE